MRFVKWFGFSVAVLILLLGLVVGGAATYDAVIKSSTVVSWQAERDARRDVTRGIYKQLIVGLPVAWLWDYKQTMKARYNIDVVVEGCIVRPGELAYNSAYNKVSKSYVVNHFGRDVYSETIQQSEADYMKAHPQLSVSK